MKAKKLMELVSQFLDADSKTQQEEIKSIRKVLKELKGKELKLRAKLAEKTHSDPEDAEAIKLKLDVIYAQRRKGVMKVFTLKRKSVTNKNTDKVDD
ncbi:hypothetical protein [Marinospirillum insulare]|uniref:Uncharacterized protein n=1 Tax=Marinospirillum insulare TaxID=217169 RepID=A0ABQ6A3Y3_9GAMM|nr:hypothetical protein [Marinospirillum insulare]GLR64814.1 hypothetical protein GCM10007878_22520 [Marinospirillum insulare]